MLQKCVRLSLEKRMNKVSKIVFYLGLLALWQSICALGIWPDYLFPSPLQVGQSLIFNISKFSFWVALVNSLRRVLIGYSISIVFGTLLGLLMARFKTLEKTLGSLILGLHSLPSLCWLPIGILWFGLSDASIIMVIVFSALFSLAISIDDSIKNVPPIYLRAGRTMGQTGWRLYWEIVLPSALPGILSGFKQGWTFAWRALLAAELMFVGLGIGNLLQQGRELNDTAQIFAVMIVIVMIGVTIDFYLFGTLQKHVRSRWGFHSK